MVEANSEATGAADGTLAFFDTIFNTVPPVYRQVDREHLVDIPKTVKNGKKPSKQKNVSLLELNEKAHERVEEIRRANATKSQQKIKELTVEHQKKKNAPVDPDVIMQGDSDDQEEESKVTSGGKKNGHKREPLEKKTYASKDTLAASKLANKRTQKEALKRNKVKRNKGTLKDEDGPTQNKKHHKNKQAAKAKDN